MAALAGVLVIVGIAFLISVAIWVVVCLILYSAMKRVPAAHRRAEPGLAWLLLIPVFNLVWNFIYLPKVSESLASALAAQGDTTAGDAGGQLALVYAILMAIATAGAFIPIVNCFSGVASLAGFVILIIYLVKVNGLKNRLRPA